MDWAPDAVRQVWLGRPKVRASLLVLAVAGLLLAPGPAAALRAEGVDDVGHELASARAELADRAAQVDRLAQDAARLELELADARATVATVGERLDQARGEVRVARATRSSAVAALARAASALDAARSRSQAAALRLRRSRTALGSAEAAARTAADRARATASAVTRATVGSRAHRRAFVRWQMAAVASEAAHARRDVAEEAVDDGELGVAVAGMELDEAQQAHDEALGRRQGADDQLERARGSVAALRAERAAAREEVEDLGSSLVGAQRALDDARSVQSDQEASVASLEVRLASLEQAAGGEGARPTGRRTAVPFAVTSVVAAAALGSAAALWAWSRAGSARRGAARPRRRAA